MFWQYLKAQLWVLLCGGVAGPIFLGVYLSVGEPGVPAWMWWAGLLITVASVLLALVLTARGMKLVAGQEELRRTGVLALADITGIAETGVSIGDEPVVKVSLHVAAPEFTAFDSELRVTASVLRLSNITSRKLVVLVDPSTREHQIDWERSSLVNGLVPAHFSLPGDDRTYDLSGQAGPLMEIFGILRDHGIPLSQMVDVRSNPAAGQQLQAVVRRATSGEYKASVAERLRELEKLRDDGTVTVEEYTALRSQILSDL
ncbi:SHOCT domain-containing protein [Mycobacterium sp. Z3061]|uniref:SHOCT domain-containing protein n=1 Tax=Mycobacterium sp. Z3061 TaxID=3073562 RepID=UPI00287321A4|nr:SHOCT domain-containing protein [Mycobacterium sp. Z3061]